MKNEPTAPHFARPFHFGSDNVADQECSVCSELITLWTRPDGTKVWRHEAEVERTDPDYDRYRPRHNGTNVTDGGPL